MTKGGGSTVICDSCAMRRLSGMASFIMLAAGTAWA